LYLSICQICIVYLTDEEDQKKGLERELMELRQQVTRSVGASSETEELRRSLEKSERQRVQLSDHIEVQLGKYKH